MAGFQEIRTPEEVDNFIRSTKGTALYFINSVCGCTNGVRKGLIMSLKHPKKPQKLVTSFAGADLEAVDRIREHLRPNPPSSPAVALFKDGSLVKFIPREEFVERESEEICAMLQTLYEKYF